MSFKLLPICYQILSMETNGKTHTGFKTSSCLFFLFAADKIFQMPPIHITCFKDQPKNHPQQESGIHPQRAQSRDAWASSGSQELRGTTPAAAPPHHLLLALPGDHQDKSLILSGRAQSETVTARKEHGKNQWHLTRCGHSLKKPICPSAQSTVFKHGSSLT